MYHHRRRTRGRRTPPPPPGEGEALYGSKANFGKTDTFVWVMGTRDTEVWPRQGEQWGQVSLDYPKSTKTVPMNQSTW